MKIKRFFENEVQGPVGTMDLSKDISSSRVEEIIKDISSFMDNFEENLNKLKKYEEELAKYKSKSKKSNDQIDDSIVELQQVNKSIEQDVQSKLDTLIEKLKDYVENGRNYIYEE
jgi:uncharacterized coiled-coil DUF342 family protein